MCGKILPPLGYVLNPPTRRGRRGGRRHPRIIKQLHDQPGTNNTFNIPCIVTANRPKQESKTHVDSKPSKLVYPYIHREPLLDIRVWNARSIRNKTTTLNAYVIQHDIDIVFLTETWLATDDPVVIGELKPDGYDYLNFPLGTSNHGGTGVLFKSQLGFILWIFKLLLLSILVYLIRIMVFITLPYTALTLHLKMALQHLVFLKSLTISCKK